MPQQPLAQHTPLFLEPTHWTNYELLDSGNFTKLERFGNYTLIRPEPQAVWQPTLPEAEWNKLAHARFEQQGSHNGKWIKLKPIDDRWQIQYQGPDYDFKMRLALTGFKHVGIFPEQAVNWDYIYKQCRAMTNPLVINLFAYTGGATLAARAAGAKVVHLDAVKQVVTWANDNAKLNNYDNISWLVEDALKFLLREVKRGKVYNGIILDPPAFGHGPNGERWKLEDNIAELTTAVAKALHPTQGFLVFNAYSLGFSSLIIRNLIEGYFSPAQCKMLETGELYLAEKAGKRMLPTGVFGRIAAQ